MKDSNEKLETVVTDKNEPTELVVAPEQGTLLSLSKEELLAKLDRASKANIDECEEAGTQYWEAEKGKEMRGIFLGFKAIIAKDGKNAGEIIPCPVIQVSQYKAYMSAAVQLAGSFQIVPIGAAVYIKCEEAKSGQAAIFTVKVIEA